MTSGNPVILQLAKIAANCRHYPDEHEKARIRSALINAEREIKIPGREEVLEHYEAIDELWKDIQSCVASIRTGQEDLRRKIKSIRRSVKH